MYYIYIGFNAQGMFKIGEAHNISKRKYNLNKKERFQLHSYIAIDTERKDHSLLIEAIVRTKLNDIPFLKNVQLDHFEYTVNNEPQKQMDKIATLAMYIATERCKEHHINYIAHRGQ